MINDSQFITSTIYKKIVKQIVLITLNKFHRTGRRGHENCELCNYCHNDSKEQGLALLLFLFFFFWLSIKKGKRKRRAWIGKNIYNKRCSIREHISYFIWLCDLMELINKSEQLILINQLIMGPWTNFQGKINKEKNVWAFAIVKIFVVDPKIKTSSQRNINPRK